MTGINRFFNGDRFPDTDAQSRDVLEWRGHYRQLAGVLGGLGTEILTKVTSETDAQVEPYYFTEAVHEYVFPPQARTLIADLSRPIEGTSENNLAIVDKIYDIDEGLVKGRIRVSYNDRGSCIQFRVEDILGFSDIPPDAQFAIDQLEGVTQPFFTE